MPRNRMSFIIDRILYIPVATLALATLSPVMSASPIAPCATATVSTYDVAGFQCSIDGYILEDFTFSASQTGGATLLSDSQIDLDPTVTPGGMSFQFSGVDNTIFSVPDGQTAEYVFQYELDPLLPKITGGTVTTGPGDPVVLTGQFCGNGTLTTYVAGQQTTCSGTDPAGIFPATAVVNGNNMSTNYQFPVTVTDLDTRLILDLDGPANVTTFGTSVNVSPTPEPSSALWLAPAMLGLAWLRRSRQLVSR